MAQHDYNLANQPGATFRADLNAALEAIATKNSGASGPSVTFANMWWYDSTNALMKIRNPANTAWITFASWSGTQWVIDANWSDRAVSGNWWGGALRSVFIQTNGITEIGGSLDFHPDAAGVEDYRLRITRAVGVNGLASILQTGTGGINIATGTGGFFLNSTRMGFLPVGSIMPWVNNAAIPDGWLLLNGQNVSRSTYADLFAAMSTIYGAGNGTTTFTLPDLRGRVIAGKDNMGGVSANRLTGLAGGIDGDVLGATGGDESHVLTTAQLATHSHANTASSSAITNTTVNAGGAHAHTFPVVDDDGNFGTVGPAYSSRVIIAGTINTDTAIAHAHTATSATSVTTNMTNANAGSNDPHNNVQPTIIFNYIVFTGV